MTTINRNHAILEALEVIIADEIRSLSGSTKQLSLSSLRTMYLASTSHDLIRTENTCTKRDIYYCIRTLFPSVSTVERALLSLCRELDIESNDLGIVSAPKGLISGPLSFVGEQNDLVVVNHFGGNGILIPVRPERLRSVSTNARLLLVYDYVPRFADFWFD